MFDKDQYSLVSRCSGIRSTFAGTTSIDSVSVLSDRHSLPAPITRHYHCSTMHPIKAHPITSKPEDPKVDLDREALEEQLWDIDEEKNFFIKDEIIRCTEYACDRFELPVLSMGDWVVRRWYLHCQEATHVQSREARRRWEVPDGRRMKVFIPTAGLSEENVGQKVEGEDPAAGIDGVSEKSTMPFSSGKMGIADGDINSDGHLVSLGLRNLYGSKLI